MGDIALRSILFLLALLLPLPAGSQATMQDTVHKHIRVAKAWVRETSEGRAALHVTIANTGDRADRLVRVATSIAKRVVISDQEGRNATELTIPGSAEFVFGSAEPRIELVGLKRTLRAQERFNLLLVFDQAGKVSVDVLVETGAPPAAIETSATGG
jgi:periplasmic copper chaperone A